MSSRSPADLFLKTRACGARPATIASDSAVIGSRSVPNSESYLRRYASVLVSVRSLIATNSISSEPKQARTKQRPILPKPLIPTLIAIWYSFVLVFVRVFGLLQSSVQNAPGEFSSRSICGYTRAVCHLSSLRTTNGSLGSKLDSRSREMAQAPNTLQAESGEAFGEKLLHSRLGEMDMSTLPTCLTISTHMESVTLTQCIHPLILRRRLLRPSTCQHTEWRKPLYMPRQQWLCDGGRPGRLRRRYGATTDSSGQP